jgi:hypothetical protein
MTSHKDGSHKATKVKHEDVTEQKRKRKALKPATAASPTAVPIVTPHPSSRRPKKKKRVVDTNNLASLRTFRVAVSKTIPDKLHDGNLMPWIRASVLSTKEKAAPHVVKKKAINSFAPMKYNRKVTVVPGKSLRIATLFVAAAADDVETADTPAVPCFATLLTTEHTNLRRYLLEDILFAEVGMQVLFCVAPTHPNYESYEAMHDSLPTKVPRWSIGDVSYLQLNAIIVLHPRRSDLIGCVLTRDQMLHLLTGNGLANGGSHDGRR